MPSPPYPFTSEKNKAVKMYVVAHTKAYLSWRYELGKHIFQL